MIQNELALSSQLKAIANMSNDFTNNAVQGSGIESDAKRLKNIAGALQELVDGPFSEMMETISTCEIVLKNQRQCEVEHEQQTRMHRQWQQERESQMAALEKENSDLQQAWDAVESEKRKLEASQRFSPGNASTPQPPAAMADWTPENAPAPIDQLNSLFGEAQQPDPPAAAAPTSDADSFAFQQLRREMRKHSQRKY